MDSNPAASGAEGIWPPFKRYFVTAQLIAGLSLAFKGFVAEGLFGAVLGFAVAAPVTAAIVLVKVLVDRRFPPKPGPLRTRWLGAIVVGLVVCGSLVGLAVLLHRA